MGILGSQPIILPGARVPRTSGWEAVKKFPMPRNSEAIWLDVDDEKKWMYLKVVDENGVEACERYRYETDHPEEFAPDKYVTKEELNSLREEMKSGFDSIKNAIERSAQ